MDHAAMIEELWDREAIRQCVTRYARGVDRFDAALIRSAFHPDALDEHGKFVGTPDEFVAWALEQHGRAHLSHQHMILNHSCELAGATAHAETYFMFVAMNRAGEVLTMLGGRYVDRLEKRDGAWRIAARVCLRDWMKLDVRPDLGDLAAMTSTAALLSDDERTFMRAGRGGSRDRADPSYDRPLTVDPARREAFRARMGG